MFDRYIEQLSSQDVEVRRLAIIALGDSADQRALAALANVYKNDPDPALRDLALKAGRHIKRTTMGSMPEVQAAPQPPATPATQAQSTLPKVSPFDMSRPFTGDPGGEPVSGSTPALIAEPETQASSTAFVTAEPLTIIPLPKITPLPVIVKPTTSTAPRKITDREKRLAKGKLDSAIGMMTHGEIDRALNELVEAVQINPGLAQDTLAMNLATRVTGMNSPVEAMQTIVNRARLASSNTTKASPKNIKITLDSDAQKMLIMIGVLALVMAGVGLTYKYTLLSVFEAVGKLGRPRPSTQLAVAELRGITIGDTLKFGALFTFDSLFDTVTLYVVGTWLGGSGLVFQFIRALLRIQVVMYFAVAIGMGLLAAGLKASGTMSGSGSGLILLGAAVVGLSLVIGFIWKIFAVGRNHEVGFVMAFMITLAGTVLSYLAIGIIPIA